MNPHEHHGRLAVAPAPEIAEHVNAHMMSNSLGAFESLIRYHRAYLVMLARCRIMPRSTAAILLRALRELEQAGLAALCLDPARHEELQPALEAWVIGQVGVDHGGQLNTGRSRQECQMVAEQLLLRDEVLALLEVLLGLLETADEADGVCNEHRRGHLLKHMSRLLRSYRELNLSRAGVGSVVPTSFRIDRDALARLLGFGGSVQNSLYGYSAFDVEIGLLAVVRLLAADVVRWLAGAQRHNRPSGSDLSERARVLMHETQRAHMVASNLYLDTTPMIRGAITFATQECFRAVVRLRMVLTAARKDSRLHERPRLVKSEIAFIVRSVQRERARLRRADMQLQRQAGAYTSASPSDALKAKNNTPRATS